MKDFYIGEECRRDAAFFFNEMDDQVHNFTVLVNMGVTEGNGDSMLFVKWWNDGKYTEEPHSLLLLLEAEEKLNAEGKDVDCQNIGEFMKHKMERLYEALKDAGYE